MLDGLFFPNPYIRSSAGFTLGWKDLFRLNSPLCLIPVETTENVYFQFPSSRGLSLWSFQTMQPALAKMIKWNQNWGNTWSRSVVYTAVAKKSLTYESCTKIQLKMNGELFCCFFFGGVTFCVDSFRLGRRSVMPAKRQPRPSCVHFFFLSFLCVDITAVHSFSCGSATSIFLRVVHTAAISGVLLLL